MSKDARPYLGLSAGPVDDKAIERVIDFFVDPEGRKSSSTSFTRSRHSTRSSRRILFFALHRGLWAPGPLFQIVQNAFRKHGTPIYDVAAKTEKLVRELAETTGVTYVRLLSLSTKKLSKPRRATRRTPTGSSTSGGRLRARSSKTRTPRHISSPSETEPRGFSTPSRIGRSRPGCSGRSREAARRVARSAAPAERVRPRPSRLRDLLDAASGKGLPRRAASRSSSTACSNNSRNHDANVQELRASRRSSTRSCFPRPARSGWSSLADGSSRWAPLRPRPPPVESKPPPGRRGRRLGLDASRHASTRCMSRR